MKIILLYLENKYLFQSNLCESAETGVNLCNGLYYMNARYYDPNIGTFMTADPAMSGLNHYAYASANPIKYTDPTGMQFEDSTWGLEDAQDEYDKNEAAIKQEFGDYPEQYLAEQNSYYHSWMANVNWGKVEYDVGKNIANQIGKKIDLDGKNVDVLNGWANPSKLLNGLEKGLRDLGASVYHHNYVGKSQEECAKNFQDWANSLKDAYGEKIEFDITIGYSIGGIYGSLALMDGDMKFPETFIAINSPFGGVHGVANMGCGPLVMQLKNDKAMLEIKNNITNFYATHGSINFYSIFQEHDHIAPPYSAEISNKGAPNIHNILMNGGWAHHNHVTSMHSYFTFYEVFNCLNKSGY